MNLRKWMGGWMIVLLASSVLAGTAAPTSREVTLTLDLADGSRLVGQCAPASMTIATDYARIEAPFEQIAQIVLDDAHTSAVVTLRNGNKITGAIQGDVAARGFQIRSLMGPLTVALKHVRRVEMESSGDGHYNARRDFSDRRNPAGAWSYGMKINPRAEFSAFKESRRDEQVIAVWFSPNDGPCLAVNTGKELLHPCNTMDLPPDVIDIHPGADGAYSVVRWTAPRAGEVRITGRFTGLSGYQGAPPTTTDVRVMVNGNESFLKLLNQQGQGNQAAFDVKAEVPAGGVVEFMVGFGNGNYGYDSTGLEADITLTETSPAP